MANTRLSTTSSSPPFLEQTSKQVHRTLSALKLSYGTVSTQPPLVGASPGLHFQSFLLVPKCRDLSKRRRKAKSIHQGALTLLERQHTIRGKVTQHANRAVALAMGTHNSWAREHCVGVGSFCLLQMLLRSFRGMERKWPAGFLWNSKSSPYLVTYSI